MERDREYIEMGSEPEVYATEIKIESAGHGNARVCYYREHRKGVFHLLFATVVPEALLPHWSATFAAARNGYINPAEGWDGATVN